MIKGSCCLQKRIGKREHSVVNMIKMDEVAVVVKKEVAVMVEVEVAVSNLVMTEGKLETKGMINVIIVKNMDIMRRIVLKRNQKKKKLI